MRILGAILAGGEARRFGADKAAALLAGRPLIEHVAAALAPHVEEVVVVGRQWPGLADVPDPSGLRLGPLGGLLSALDLAGRRGFAAVLSAPCDTPHLPRDLLVQLAGRTCAYVPQLPVLGIWPAALAPQLAAHLGVDLRLSMRGWAKVAGAVAIDWPQEIANVNHPGDLDRLRDGEVDMLGNERPGYGPDSEAMSRSR